MKHTITGCLVKYEEPWYDGKTVIAKGAFDGNGGKKVPISENGYFYIPNSVIGYAELEEREDGIWFTAELNDTKEAESNFWMIQDPPKNKKWFFGFYANHIRKEEKEDGPVAVIGGQIIGVYPIEACDQSAWIETLDGEPYQIKEAVSNEP